MRKSAILLLLLITFANAYSQDNIILRYDFTNVSGTSVTDVSANAVKASLKNSAKVEDMGKYKVLNLGTSNGYLDMTSTAGKLIQELSDFTVSCYYRVDKDASLSGNGYFLWAFSDNQACAAGSGIYHAYRLNAQRIATSTGGYNNETGYSVGRSSATDEWIHVAYTQSGTKGILYIDGQQIGTISGMPILSSTFTSAPSYCWIGRAPFSGDSYLKSTLVYDFCVYNEALSAESVASLAERTESLDYEYRYGTPGDFTSLQNAVDDAKAFINSISSADYPINAISEFEDAITVAEDIIRERKVNQDIIDSYVSAISTAKTKLQKTKGFVFDISDVIEGYNPENRGFRHPGGLHTQADFDRIKRQLAEGNEKVTAAYKILKSAEYAQPSTATYPVETILRGGDGQNYMNAARGAAIAYQNALRWKIEDNKACAKHAVDVLMAWCNTTKHVSGTSDQCLARGLYGYQFAQAAELMRDYEGWSEEDFTKFQRWMLDVWYPGAIGFLRVRNGTWENADKWWQAPGHYWSNWGLCNALCVISIGVLCDDVNIYNQGMSFIKYDQVGTFQDPRTADPILNDGLTEFWGNLIVTTTESELETGAYGKLGQMNESGRDTGHSAMALGLAVDIAHQGWNQGDDLFSYMDHRLAAGIEYVAAQTQSVENLPWTNYHYGSNGYYYTDYRAWLMTGPALGAQMRPYWGTVIGHYEGIKGVTMPFSEISYENMGIDTGGLGATSGGYDHLGYSVLMNTRDGLATAEQIPVELIPYMTYNGTTVAHNELGCLKNTYQTTAVKERGVAAGTVITLTPTLPEGTTDTGNWKWNTGETTREITITADRSYIYRVTYTNENGVESELSYAIAVQGDCNESTVTAKISNKDKTVTGTTMQVFYGTEVTLQVYDNVGFNNFVWDNGQTTSSISIPQITTSRDIQCYVQTISGRKEVVTFHLDVTTIRPDIIVNNTTIEDTVKVIVSEGDKVVLSPNVPDTQAYGTWNWDDGSSEQTYTIDSATESEEHTVSYTLDGHTSIFTYTVYVKEAKDRLIEQANYLIRHRYTDTYLTNNGDSLNVSFEPATGDLNQVWCIEHSGSTARYNLCSMSDSLLLKKDGTMYKLRLRPHYISCAAGTNYCAFYNSSSQYWYLDEDNNLIMNEKTVLDDYAFELIPYAGGETGINKWDVEDASDAVYYTISGVRISKPQKGIYIMKTKNSVRKIINR